MDGPVRKSLLSIRAEQEYNKRVKEENRLKHQQETERRNRVAAFVSEWQDNAIHISMKAELKQIQEMTQSEMQAAGRELLLLRRQEMRALLERDRQMLDEELAQRGLAVHKDRL
ncbi:hypothetical protein DFJ73DRAFT_798801 [Zopfochytrium polystomum]|nr:hypothetical protein DFJ73DRAFT_798801 [Zopfochytrium polystomum]